MLLASIFHFGKAKYQSGISYVMYILTTYKGFLVNVENWNFSQCLFYLCQPIIDGKQLMQFYLLTLTKLSHPSHSHTWLSLSLKKHTTLHHQHPSHSIPLYHRYPPPPTPFTLGCWNITTTTTRPHHHETPSPVLAAAVYNYDRQPNHNRTPPQSLKTNKKVFLVLSFFLFFLVFFYRSICINEGLNFFLLSIYRFFE